MSGGGMRWSDSGCIKGRATWIYWMDWMMLVVRKRGVDDNSKIFFLVQLEGGLSFVHMEKIQKERFWEQRRIRSSVLYTLNVTYLLDIQVQMSSRKLGLNKSLGYIHL